MMSMTWTDVFVSSFQGIWFGIISVVPNIIISLIIFIIGWVVAVSLAKVIAHVVHILKVDNALRSAGVEQIVTRAGFTLNTGAFLGELVKWFIIIIFLVASFEKLGLYQVNEFLRAVITGFLPQVIIAVLILLVAAIIAEFVKKTVFASAKAANISSAGFLSSIAKFAIWIFAVLAALVQLNIAAALFQTLFTGFVIALALALGLSFGLGGQKAAAELIEKVKNDISK